MRGYQVVEIERLVLRPDSAALYLHTYTLTDSFPLASFAMYTSLSISFLSPSTPYSPLPFMDVMRDAYATFSSLYPCS